MYFFILRFLRSGYSKYSYLLCFCRYQLVSLKIFFMKECISKMVADEGASYTIPDCYRSGVTFIPDRGLSYTTPHQSGTQRSTLKITPLWR